MENVLGTIVITGAAGGIGTETVRLMAEKGLSLLCTDLQDDRLAQLKQAVSGLPGRVETVASNLATPEECRRVVRSASSPVTGLVHLAGVFEPDPVDGAVLDDMSVYERAIAYNLTNAYVMANAVVEAADASEQGAMLFASSMAFTRGSVNYVSYASAKGGLVGLTRALCRRLAPQFRVNSVAPGLISTPMPQKVIEKQGVEKLVADIPLKRLGAAREVATVIDFLMSDAASYISGQTINIDGGVAFS